MNEERVLCGACGKRVKPQFQPKEPGFFCPKCGHELPLSRACRRRLTTFRIVYHLTAFALILLAFALLMDNGHSVPAVAVAVVAVPLAARLERALETSLFFQRGRYEFEVPAIRPPKGR